MFTTLLYVLLWNSFKLILTIHFKPKYQIQKLIKANLNLINRKYNNPKNKKDMRKKEFTYKICTALWNWQRPNTTKNYNAIKQNSWTQRIDGCYDDFLNAEEEIYTRNMCFLRDFYEFYDTLWQFVILPISYLIDVIMYHNCCYYNATLWFAGCTRGWWSQIYWSLLWNGKGKMQ